MMFCIVVFPMPWLRQGKTQEFLTNLIGKIKRGVFGRGVFANNRLPRGPKDQKNSRFRSRLKISIGNEIFERATHRGPIFCGEIETSRLKFSSEIKNFDRDWKFRSRSNIFDRWALWLVLKPDVAIASEVSILSKSSLAITDFHAKKTQHVQLFEDPLPGTPLPRFPI